MAAVAYRSIASPFEIEAYQSSSASHFSSIATQRHGRQLPPQPEFSFPSRPLTPVSGGEFQDLLQNSSSNTSTRTHTRAINSMSALPAFTFNPSVVSGSADISIVKDPSYTVSAPTTPARGGRHRRTASELIGGSANFSGSRSGHSPTKAWMEYSMPPATPVFGSLPSRLEPRHRRNNTMSSQDTSLDINQAAIEDDVLASTSFAEVPTSTQHSSVGSHPSPVSQSLFGRPRERGNTSRSPPIRHRVGFSENVEFIPRPLSTISSESGSSMSTVRAHSASASISSVMASGASSPLGKPMHSPLRKSFDSASSPIKTYSKTVGSASAITTDRHSTFDDQPLPLASPVTTPEPEATPTLASTSESTATAGDARKLRRAPHWVSLLGRKVKHNDAGMPYSASSLDVTSPDQAATIAGSPEVPQIELSEDFDANPTSIIVADYRPFDTNLTMTPPLTPNEQNVGEDCTSTAPQSSAIIDLDALMAEDNSRDARFSKTRPLNGTRRSMHSSTTGSGFLASTTHRRADSAPSIIPDQLDAAGFRERNSSFSSFKPYKMEDVFEEEEDTSYVTAARGGKTLSVVSNSETQCPSMTTPSDVSDHGSIATPPVNVPRRLRFVTTVPSPVNSPSGTLSSNRFDPSDGYEHRRPSSETGCFSVSDYQSLKHARSMESETFPIRNRFYGSNELRSSSPLSSGCGCGKDCSTSRHSDLTPPIGLDSRRPYAQSLADRGSDLRYSVDDVPSLISSRSTVTSAANARALSTSSRGVAHQRSTGSSVSLSGGAERRRKRSSIASFSRFVGSSFGERSSQPFEPGKRWQNPIDAKDVKTQKSSRFGRLMRFWKPKQMSTPIS